MSGTKLVLLGTGNPNPDPCRSGPSSAVVVDGSAYLIDAGPGVVRQAAAAYEKGLKALEPRKLDKIFITHLHSDHTLGLPDLIFTPWVMERRGPLEVWGPEGTERMCGHMIEAFKDDIKVRTEGLEGANDTGYKVVVKEIAEGEVHRDDSISITAFRVKHGSWKHSFGYRMKTDDGMIVISGDCSITRESIENYKGADILLHEVHSSKGFTLRPGRWQEYHRSSHTSTVDLARIAKVSKPGRLILYHQLLWGRPEQELIDEIGQIYDGDVVSGHDLDIFPL